MLSDEEREAIEIVKGITEDDLLNYWEGPEEPYNAIQIILNLIEKQQKEIEELKDFIVKLQATKDRLDNYDKENTIEIEKLKKEIEELKDDRKKYAEEYIHNNPWLYKQLNENYILRVESEQKERKAWIKGTNDAHELCNKKWVKKIKALMEKEDKLFFETKDVRHANRYKAYKELIKEE